MPKLSSLTVGDVRHVTIPVADGEVVHMVIRPGRLTGDAILRVTEQENESLAFLYICELLGETVDSWDITNEDGSPFPVAPESIRQLPLGFVMEVFNKLQESQNPPTPSGRSFTTS